MLYKNFFHLGKHIICLVFLLLSFLGDSQEFGEYTDALTKSVCNLDEPISPRLIIAKNQPLEPSSELHEYLKRLKILFNQRFAKYNLRVISDEKTAAAHYQFIDNDVARVITINKSYYEEIANENDTEALIIWVLAHEFSHHVHGDITYDQDGIVANNLAKEVLADNRAGYAVGKLTEANISFFEEVLPKVLGVNKYSNTHPPLKYRIYASEMGWVEAKAEESDQLKNLKYQSTSNREYYLWEKQEKPDLIYEIWEDGDIYFGKSSGGSAKGDGFTIFFDGNIDLVGVFFGESDGTTRNGVSLFRSGAKYIGQWNVAERNTKTDKRLWLPDGYGSSFYNDNVIFRGIWKNGKKHGDGVLYKGKEVIQSGCWENDKYIGEHCN